jgi:hypothetical protein
VLGYGLGPDLVTDDYAADHATLPFGTGPHPGQERDVGTHAV